MRVEGREKDTPGVLEGNGSSRTPPPSPPESPEWQEATERNVLFGGEREVMLPGRRLLTTSAAAVEEAC